MFSITMDVYEGSRKVGRKTLTADSGFKLWELWEKHRKRKPRKNKKG